MSMVHTSLVICLVVQLPVQARGEGGIAVHQLVAVAATNHSGKAGAFGNDREAILDPRLVSDDLPVDVRAHDHPQGNGSHHCDDLPVVVAARA
jgi:hypothetical protein